MNSSERSPIIDLESNPRRDTMLEASNSSSDLKKMIGDG